jgi:subtilisin-like proprotein convertase family protein
MRTRWLILSLCLLCLASAWFFWHQPANTPTRPSALQKVATPPVTTVRSASTAPNILATVSTNAATSAKTNQFAYRLSNTTKTIGQLVGDPHAILLENALIDTGAKLTFSIPKNLQSPGDPGAYIVQARGPIDNAFRAMLAAAGAEIVSYIPNNAYLVRAQAGVANGLAGNPLTQGVIPYEPYYKIQLPLLAAAVEDEVLPPGTELNLGLFADTAPQTILAIPKLGGMILARGSSPFGPVVRVQPPQNWTALATLPGVQIVEPYHPRVHANDLSRATVGVAVDTQTTTNYLNLSGSNVLVAVNDSGIDAAHPDFTAGGTLPTRVLGAPTIDTDGHGTHVAGIIAGDGTESMTVTNAQGSIMPATNGQFRGMAPLANLLSMGWGASDQELQEAAAQTNALISNNSWYYGGDNNYDLAAASYDEAVRDALPGLPGSQPVLFVFSAGNDGGGNNDGGGGDPNTILSPATAKNVITVGALELLRNITNIVTDRNSNSTAVWQPETDTSFQVAGYSSRGNVGVGTEGTFGRYKPDVVAPGTFVISTRSSQWDEKAYYNPTNYSFNFFTNQVVDPNTLNRYSLSIPANAVGAIITITANRFSPTPFPTNLPIYVRKVDFPTTNVSDFVTRSNGVSIPPNASIQTYQNSGFFFAVGNTNNFSVNYDLTTEVITTNDLGNYYAVLSNLNNSLGGDPDSLVPPHYYRYETGTSMSAADVSGVLALMQDYFTNKLSLRPSPALLKAMLINGARADGNYDFQVTNSINYQGWGLVNLPNSLPPGMTNELNAACASFFVDQDPASALATGDSRTYEVDIPDGSDQQFLPLQVTLAWTDPPGNPAAAIKLVNNLDLVVSNAVTGEVFYGNDIGQGQIYNTPEVATNTPNLDSINNVENVLISPLLGTTYFITVIGRSVNANAVTAHPNNVVQDYALVISCGEGEVTNAFTVTTNATSFVSNPTGDQQITFVTSTNTPLMNQIVGASTPLLGTNQIPLGTNLVWSGTNSLITLGLTNQWHFYVVVNNGVDASGSSSDVTNAAFVTFIPDTLSIPREGVFADSVANATRPEADIDLYVTTDRTLTNLNPAAISNCVNGAQVGASSANAFNGASLGRGGTEFVVDTNSTPGEVYYVGVYSEDQMASEYGFISIFSSIPFSQPGPNGSQIVNGLPEPVDIPDGSPLHPGTGYVFGLALYPMQVKRVVVAETITHQNFGDLIGTLTHSQQTGLGQRDVLNNHDSLYNASGIYTNIYDDSNQGDIAGAQPSSGPGSVNNFIGQEGIGPWILTEVDDALTHTGSVTGFSLLIEPHQDPTKGISGIVYGNSWFYDYFDVPAGATNFTISATNNTMPPLPLFLFVNTNTAPTLTNFIAMVGLTNVSPLGLGGSISIGPPLTPGRYWYGLWNPNLAPQSFTNLIVTFGMGAVPGQVIFSSSGPAWILDDAVMTNSIYVSAAQNLSSVEVALRVDHPRVSDLVFHLISPDGTRCLLVENRGGTTTNGMGATIAITNIVPVSSSGSASPTTNLVTTVSINGTLTVDYDFQQIPDEMVVFDQGGNLIFDSGMISYSGVFNIAYTNSSILTIVMNPNGNPNLGTYWAYTVNALQAYYTYLVLTEDTNKTTTPIKYAVPPFHGTPILTPVTNAVVTTNMLPVTSKAFGWHSSFESTNTVSYDPAPGSYFPEGWHLDSGTVDVLVAPIFGSTAFEGTTYIDIDGGSAGTISTNVVTVPGQTYQLSLAYAQNPNRRGTEVVQLQTNGSPLLTLTLNNPTNTWTGLGWATTSLLFTATSPSTPFTFASQTPGSSGVLLDAIDLAPLSGANGFERAAAGDYAQGHYFDGWFVNNYQVTVISNATLAYSGTNLLALADGVISRLLPTVPGRTYTLTYAYRGPGAVGLWRGENNANDSIYGNNGTIVNTGFTNGVVGKAFACDPENYAYGTYNAVDIPDSPAYILTNSLSIEGWVRPRGNSYTIFWRGDNRSGYDPYFMGMQVNNTIRCYITDAGNNSAFVGTNIAYGQWWHVAATLNGGSGALQFYLNGVLVAQTNTTIRPYGILTGFHPGVGIGNLNDGGNNFPFIGDIDEISLYSRALSASEIKAIYNHYSSGKYNTTAPSIAAGLAEAQVTVGGTNLFFFGNNTNWQTTNITFTAALSNTVLQITGLEPGMLLDNFALTQLVFVTNNVVTTNASGGDVYYLPEQSLDTYKGLNAYGQWQLEIWDNRVGAGLTNTLVSWQLRFNFATTVSSIGVLTNGLAVTNVIPPGGMAYYLVIVPPNADIATNRLLFATGPLNVWFNQTTLPAGINPPDYLLIPNSTGGSSVLSLTSTPNIVPGGTYYLGVQNTGTSNITYGIEVDFHLLFPPALPFIGTQITDELTLMTVTNTASSANPPLIYSVSGPPGVAISTNGIITWTPTEAQGPGFYTIQTTVTDSSVPPLHSINSFNVIVIEVNTAPFFLGTPSNQTINAFSTLVVTNAAGDSDIPANPLTYTLLNPPAGMTIDNNGAITWTPTLAQALTTNLIATVVTDFNAWAPVNQILSATNYFTVFVTGVQPPFAFTQPATSVTGTSAQLNGMATPNGPPTTAWFEWGTSATYGNQTPPVSVGGGYNVVYVPSQINGLVMNQPYHFLLVVSNVLGVVYGFDQIFDETGVVAWGADYVGQTDVPSGLSNVVAVAGAYDHSLALKNDGTVVAWGDNTKNQTNVPAGLNGVVAVAGGQYYSLALKNDGTVAPWGGSILGQTNVPAGLNGVVNIAGGTFSSLALKSNGRVVAWGASFFGLTNTASTLSNIVAVAGGGYHSLAVKNDGTVLAWGNNSSGQTNVPAALSNVVAIAGGSFHSLALKKDGTVVAWGDDSDGQIDVPAGLSNVVAVAAGGFHSLVLKNDGSVLAWGDNSEYQTNIPAGLSNVVAITSGYFHNLALASPFNVNLTNTPPFFLTNPPPQTLDELTTLLVTNTANDSDLPPQTLTYTVTMLVDTNAMITNGWPLNYATTNPPPVVNSNGVITWTPSEAQGPGVYILTAVVTDNGAPPLSATNSFTVTVNEVNTPPFWPANVPSQTNYIINALSTLTVMNTATDTDIPPNPLTYQLSGPTGATIDTDGVITWTPTLAQAGTTNIFTTVVTDTNPPAVNATSLSATNSFTVTVTTLINLTGGQPQTNSVGAGGIIYYVVNVPTNADFATNILLFATNGPVNVWFDTNFPPTTNLLLLPDITYPSGTNGSVVLSASTTPPLVPGSTYYLGVQNTNSFAVTYAIEVDFHLLSGTVTGAITGLTITATNIGGTNGFLLQWQGPTNFQYEIQWTTNLAPAVWNTVLNPVINVVVTSTNGHFSFFDDGTLTGGFGPMKFYRVLGGLNLGPITGSGPPTNTVLAGAMSQAVVAVPANAISASNILISATGPLNVWFNQTNPPVGNTSAGDFLMLSATSAGAFVLTSNSVPPLVPGTNYYLGFQNLGATNVTFVFQVIFGYPPVSISSVSVLTNGNFQLQWSAPTNYQFQVAWTTNLMPPIVWNYIPPSPPYITSVTTNFTFVDTNAPTAMKFYRLVEYP